MRRRLNQRISIFSLATGVLIGAIFSIDHGHFSPFGSHLSSAQLNGIVAFLFLGGAFVVLNGRRADAAFYSEANPTFDAEKRLRMLTFLGYLFLVLGGVFVCRAIICLS